MSKGTAVRPLTSGGRSLREKKMGSSGGLKKRRKVRQPIKSRGSTPCAPGSW
jgi:hypothetical protein